MSAKLLSAAVIEVVRGTAVDIAEFPAAQRTLYDLKASGIETAILVAKTDSQTVGVLILSHPAERLVTCSWPFADNHLATRSLLESIPTALDSKSWTSQFVLLHGTTRVKNRNLLESLGWGNAGVIVRLSHNIEKQPVETRSTPGVELLDWDAFDVKTLIALLEQTMQGSLDWPEFQPFTTWPQRLARYRASPEFDPSFWRVLSLRGTPVGVAISTPHPATNSLELNYLGVIPQARGERLGELLRSDMLKLARARSLVKVNANVDAANHYALGLYKRNGFKIRSRFPLWFREFLDR